MLRTSSDFPHYSVDIVSIASSPGTFSLLTFQFRIHHLHVFFRSPFHMFWLFFDVRGNKSWARLTAWSCHVSRIWGTHASSTPGSTAAWDIYASSSHYSSHITKFSSHYSSTCTCITRSSLGSCSSTCCTVATRDTSTSSRLCSCSTACRTCTPATKSCPSGGRHNNSLDDWYCNCYCIVASVATACYSAATCYCTGALTCSPVIVTITTHFTNSTNKKERKNREGRHICVDSVAKALS